MISKATALAIAAMAAQSAAQLVSEVSVTAWDGSQRPRLESAGGDLNLHTHGDVSLNFHGRGSGVTSSLYGLVDGQESLRGDVRQIRSDMREFLIIITHSLSRIPTIDRSRSQKIEAEN